MPTFTFKFFGHTFRVWLSWPVEITREVPWVCDYEGEADSLVDILTADRAQAISDGFMLAYCGVMVPTKILVFHGSWRRL